MIAGYDEEKSMVYENGYYLTTQPSRMGNLISHYELYKKIINITGGVVELGVFKGSSLIQFATFRELLENENSREIIGFDMFGLFPEAGNESDRQFREKWLQETNHEYLSISELYQCLEKKSIGNVQLVQGDIRETLPIWLKKNPHFRIALLHIDTDVYEPAALALNLLYDRVVRGGRIVFDDYGIAGETEAVDEFLEKHNYILEKFPFSHNKPSFIVKR